MYKEELVVIAFFVALAVVVGVVLAPLLPFGGTVSQSNPAPDTGCYTFVDGWHPVTAHGQYVPQYTCEYRDTGIYALCESIPTDCPQ